MFWSTPYSFISSQVAICSNPAGEEALEFDQRRLRRFEQRRSATARREVDAAVAGLRGEPRPAVPLWGGQAEPELVITVDGNISPK